MLDCHDGIPVKPDMDGLYAPEDVRRRGSDLPGSRREPEPRRSRPSTRTPMASTSTRSGAPTTRFWVATTMPTSPPAPSSSSCRACPRSTTWGFWRARTTRRPSLAAARAGRSIVTTSPWKRSSAAANKDVVRRLERLIRLRNGHPAFDGEFRVLDSADSRLRLAWSKGREDCVLDVDFVSMQSSVECVDAQGHLGRVDL